RRAPGPARGIRDRPVDRPRRRREPVAPPRDPATVGGQLRVRPRARLRFLRGPAGARAAASGARPVTPRVQPGGGGWAGVRRRTGAAGSCPATLYTLGETLGHVVFPRVLRGLSDAVRC